MKITLVEGKRATEDKNQLQGSNQIAEADRIEEITRIDGARLIEEMIKTLKVFLPSLTKRGVLWIVGILYLKTLNRKLNHRASNTG